MHKVEGVMRQEVHSAAVEAEDRTEASPLDLVQSATCSGLAWRHTPGKVGEA